MNNSKLSDPINTIRYWLDGFRSALDAVNFAIDRNASAPYYLIESIDKNKWVRVFCIASGMKQTGQIEWASDVHVALRFSRQCDAEAFCYLHPEVAFLARITEHVDCVGPDHTQPARGPKT